MEADPAVHGEARQAAAWACGTPTACPTAIYTLRLVLEDKNRGELSTYVVVSIGEGGNIRVSPTFTPTPPPLINIGGDD